MLDVEAAKEQVKEIDANEEKMAKLEKLIGENNGICVCVRERERGFKELSRRQ